MTELTLTLAKPPQNQLLNVLQDLEAVKALLSSPDKWTQHIYAKMADHKEPVDVHSPDAACFCLHGALLRVAPETERRHQALRQMAILLGVATSTISTDMVKIHNFNDAHTYEEVIGLIDRTIAAVKAQLEPETTT